jgi:hypothetical protein
MQEPGLDRHEWESEMQALEEDLADSPGDALPELADLIERMLVGRGYDLEEPVTVEGEDPDVVREYEAAREISDLAEKGEADPGDIAQAINGLRALYDYLIVERSAP